MNDLDLRTALHRDADLVGSPSPDLLEQLTARRQHQRRQRTGVLTAVLGVIVIAAGIPLGQSLTASSDGGPATDPAPIVSTEAPAPSTEAPPVVVEAPATSASAAVEAPACPDADTLRATLPPDSATKQYRIEPQDGLVCSGSWAAAGYTETTIIPAGTVVDGVPTETDEVHPDGQAGLFHHVGGGWTNLARMTHCDDPEIPADVWERACNVD
jgi:hypothetical protein